MLRIVINYSYGGIADQAGIYVVHTYQQYVFERVNIKDQGVIGNEGTHRHYHNGNEMLTSVAIVRSKQFWDMIQGIFWKALPAGLILWLTGTMRQTRSYP